LRLRTTLRLSLASAIVGVFAAMISRPATQPNRPPAQTSTFAALSDGNVQNVFVEIVYPGPSNKPYPAVDLYAEGDPKEGFASLQEWYGDALPPTGSHMVHQVTAGELKNVLTMVSQFKAAKPKPEDSVVGIFAWQPTTKKSASTTLGAASGRDVMSRLNDIVKAPAASSSLKKLNRMIFMTSGSSARR
jgi:hypothetical protein